MKKGLSYNTKNNDFGFSHFSQKDGVYIGYNDCYPSGNIKFDDNDCDHFSPEESLPMSVIFGTDDDIRQKKNFDCNTNGPSRQKPISTDMITPEKSKSSKKKKCRKIRFPLPKKKKKKITGRCSQFMDHPSNNSNLPLLLTQGSDGEYQGSVIPKGHSHTIELRGDTSNVQILGNAKEYCKDTMADYNPTAEYDETSYFKGTLINSGMKKRQFDIISSFVHDRYSDKFHIFYSADEKMFMSSPHIHNQTIWRKGESGEDVTEGVCTTTSGRFGFRVLDVTKKESISRRALCQGRSLHLYLMLAVDKDTLVRDVSSEVLGCVMNQKTKNEKFKSTFYHKRQKTLLHIAVLNQNNHQYNENDTNGVNGFVTFDFGPSPDSLVISTPVTPRRGEEYNKKVFVNGIPDANVNRRKVKKVKKRLKRKGMNVQNQYFITALKYNKYKANEGWNTYVAAYLWVNTGKEKNKYILNEDGEEEVIQIPVAINVYKLVSKKSNNVSKDVTRTDIKVNVVEEVDECDECDDVISNGKMSEKTDDICNDDFGSNFDDFSFMEMKDEDDDFFIDVNKHKEGTKKMNEHANVIVVNTESSDIDDEEEEIDNEEEEEEDGLMQIVQKEHCQICKVYGDCYVHPQPFNFHIST